MVVTDTLKFRSSFSATPASGYYLYDGKVYNDSDGGALLDTFQLNGGLI